MWQRTEGGYEVMDRRMVEVAVDFSEKMERDAAICQTTGGSGRLWQFYGRCSVRSASAGLMSRPVGCIF